MFWCGVKEWRLQNEEIERKLIWSNANCTFGMFGSASCFL
jgi:hypothetical protein